ncbi:MAG: ABC transporter permease [Thermoplasmatales archaeon]|nr:ABC transporter permease [Thermoplasmatales archaeon]
MHTVISIAKKEFMDNFRNNWIIGLSAIFAILALLASYFSSRGQGWQDFESTTSTMMTPVQLLIPIIGLILGYATIVGEIEKGSMGSLLSHPVTRKEVILGKFLGLGSVISSTVLVGFGIAGVIIAVNVPNPDYVLYLLFIGASILLGLAFMSLALFFSSFFKSRSAAMGGAIFLWVFFTMFWQFLIFGILIATMERSSGPPAFPDWFYPIQLLNPTMTYSLINQDVLSIHWILLSLIAWTIIPMLIAFWIFKRRDV